MDFIARAKKECNSIQQSTGTKWNQGERENKIACIASIRITPPSCASQFSFHKNHSSKGNSIHCFLSNLCQAFLICEDFKRNE
jgi:hypothetical protein